MSDLRIKAQGVAIGLINTPQHEIAEIILALIEEVDLHERSYNESTDKCAELRLRLNKAD